MNKLRIILPGGAGLVGQNLVAQLVLKGYNNIIVIDKHKTNLESLQVIHPAVITINADLSKPGAWQNYFKGADVVVMLQAQIGGLFYQEFIDNNISSTELILDLIKENSIPYLVHISSSVVESVADDFYTRSKIKQEKIVLAGGIACPILRPTLMFGWFDRKHLGWLARLMQKIPVFPIPGNGKFMRQPLYVGDFCGVIISCIENRIPSGIFNISGHQKIDYIDMIRVIKRATGTKAVILKIPYGLFYALLWVWALFDKNPPFTTQQLQALVAKDEFEVTNWPETFGVPFTPFEQAIEETFNHPKYSKVVLDF
ncbi:NAD(P)-dependent oxidoreductase [Polynucleobacter sp. UK-Mo-2m-Kol15]|uniref:NAD-dependent epimerase/dehydratase family protein n=1 Tax=Polynucleobacter sp. UK-Mo-2m-Kol15 TaxID=2576916 RepID=UPI001C0CE667|nr:NAD-dependent epimerase/dehydratase family protein [Polynucleobacter sp. UK-Mo-2m-Kol15]MBU3574785.1 NAD-dependent epimerase/dehydratase family protein [Polynucleobacter sp. UK-Mo-2m-Kol15]